MSKKLTKIIASAAIVAGGIGLTAALTTQGLSGSNNDSVAVANTTSTSGKTLVDETVYVFTKADGATRKIISSDWSKNLDVDEYTKLETPNKKTPIDLKITYTLDGKEVSASEIAGKSGKVTIRYEYTNKERSGTYYIPYAVVSGLVLDNSHFSNASVKNAKIVNDGSRTIVAGVSLPGLQEDLGLSTSALEIPDYIEVTADAKDFKLGMSVSVATNEVFQNLDVSGLNSIDELTSELSKLTSAMDQLIGGSSSLYNGISELYEKAGQLPAGITALSEGSVKLASGAATIEAGIDSLASGVESLYNGINTKLVANNAALQTGAQTIYANMVSTTQSSLYNGIILGLLKTGQYSLTDAAAFAESKIPSTVAYTIENYDEKLQVLIDDATMAPFKDSISAAKNSLDNYRDQFLANLVGYTQGVTATNESVIKGQLLAGAKALQSGSAALTSGADDLSDGLSTLNTSAPALIDGIAQLQDGSLQLSNGIKQFNEEGISKLVSVFNGDIKGLTNRIETIANLAKANSSKVKYIYRVDEIK